MHAVCVADPYTAEHAVASNNAQVITFGSQSAAAVAEKLVDIWLASDYQGGQLRPQGGQINKLDAAYHKTT